MGRRLGKDAKLYIAAQALTGADPSDAANADWSEVTNVRDLTINLEKSEADVTTRGNNGWRQTMAALKDGSIEFEMVWDDEDEDLAEFSDAFINDTPLPLAVMSGDIETPGNDGLVSNFSVTNFSRSEALEDGIKVSVTIKPLDNTQWYTVGESSS